jgi:hypothetical protein
VQAHDFPSPLTKASEWWILWQRHPYDALDSELARAEYAHISAQVTFAPPAAAADGAEAAGRGAEGREEVALAGSGGGGGGGDGVEVQEEELEAVKREQEAAAWAARAAALDLYHGETLHDVEKAQGLHVAWEAAAAGGGDGDGGGTKPWRLPMSRLYWHWFALLVEVKAAAHPLSPWWLLFLEMSVFTIAVHTLLGPAFGFSPLVSQIGRSLDICYNILTYGFGPFMPPSFPFWFFCVSLTALLLVSTLVVFIQVTINPEPINSYTSNLHPKPCALHCMASA